MIKSSGLWVVPIDGFYIWIDKDDNEQYAYKKAGEILEITGNITVGQTLVRRVGS